MSVKRAQQQVDSSEFAEWIAFNNIEQFTTNKIENILAIVCSILVNVNRKKGSSACSPEDFLPKYGEQKEDSGKAMEMKLRAILNGNN